MSNIHIPPAALEAGKRELYPHLITENDDMAREIARAAFVAMVEAWEGAKRVKGYFTHDADYYEPAFILPLMENPDEA